MANARVRLPENIVRENRETIESFVEGLVTRAGSRSVVFDALRDELVRLEEGLDADDDECEDDGPREYRFYVSGEFEEELDESEVDERAEELKAAAVDYGFVNVDVEWDEL